MARGRGRSGQGQTLKLLILGDSAAAGVGVLNQQEALSGQLVERLSSSFNVHWTLHAKTGDTSVHLLEKLEHLPREPIDVAVISIGVNDVTSMTRRAQWRLNICAMVNRLSNDFACQKIYFTTVPPMHEFPALPNPLRWWLGLRVRMLNDAMAAEIQNEPNVDIVKVAYNGDENEIASDGFHPGWRGYSLWAESLGALIKRDMNKTDGAAG